MVQYCLVRFDGDTNELTTFDVVKLTRVVTDEEDGPCEGSPVQVRWRDHRGRDKGLFQATLIAIPELDGYLKSAEALVKDIKHCTCCGKHKESEDERHGAAKRNDFTDRPAMQKRLAPEAQPQTSTDLLSSYPEDTGPVSPPQPSEKKQGPCLASSMPSSHPPACPAEEDESPRLARPAGPSRVPNTGSATQLLFRWSDPDVVELQPGASVFVEQRALHAIQTAAKTPTATARGLLTAVYTRHALLTCSMKGQKAKGLHKPMAQRPPLHAAGIDAIFG
ncbi:hypothetical protein MTO96_022026 [Rhipicephalus appendiculatus]